MSDRRKSNYPKIRPCISLEFTPTLQSCIAYREKIGYALLPRDLYEATGKKEQCHNFGLLLRVRLGSSSWCYRVFLFDTYPAFSAYNPWPKAVTLSLYISPLTVSKNFSLILFFIYYYTFAIFSLRVFLLLSHFFFLFFHLRTLLRFSIEKDCCLCHYYNVD